MSNYHLAPADKPQALTPQALRSLRQDPVQGISRRTLLRRSIGGAALLWITEVAAGSIGVLWPNSRGGFGSEIEIGTFDEIKTANADIPFDKGFPLYYQQARTFIVLIDPSRQEFVPGTDEEGDGTALNVRALYQRCPHLGCKPNPCLRNYWLECPCHGSRYDRLGIKAEGIAFGPAARGMDRFAITVSPDGVLTINTAEITLGPLPVPVGQPGIIPPRSPVGCI